ncbi:hypothetical protein WJX72_007027 [[Myrmecia] bisecta]|uniref:Rubredoxin-like domain-containing protein n=1 Tax=[Myrmecia] bisecta TaxID=41462 RepID=A0AAW1Q9J0_9CHLO
MAAHLLSQPQICCSSTAQHLRQRPSTCGVLQRCLTPSHTSLPTQRSPGRTLHGQHQWRCAAADPGTEADAPGAEIENPESEEARKKSEADRLRAAERFMVVGTGEAECIGCGYTYEPKKGDPEYPVPPGTQFRDLPADWQCPICSAEKSTFQNKAKEIAGFAENQKYGLGTNSMTSGQKSILIYGSLFAFFALFLCGYFIQ